MAVPRLRHLAPLSLALLLCVCARETDVPVRGADVAVHVEGVVLDEDSKSPVVVLAESDGGRRLPIWIGFAEARSIASELQEVESVRPNTHDLATSLIEGLEGRIERVVVSDLSGGVYYAHIVLRSDGRTVEVDSRPSDAIAIALRVGAPVFVREPLFERSGERGGEAEERHI